VSQFPYRGLPSIDRLLKHPSVVELTRAYQRDVVITFLRSQLRIIRVELEAGVALPSLDEIARASAARARQEWSSGPVRVINATGVVLHTNAGRAPLSQEAQRAMVEVARYSDLELDRRSGERASRLDHLRPKLTALTGAESAHVTVNAAAALLLALAAHCRGREVLISRGQSVEIGGGFRVPVILGQSGARLVEVGTTNITRRADYADAVTPRTAAILHVHASNFRVVGFAESVDLTELAALARERGLMMIVDNGSGALLDTAQFGLAHEPTVQEAVSAGADLVAFSGDKLLGGPQSGILVGSSTAVERVARHPLARALRPDKIAVAGISATLSAYLRGDAVGTLPVWRMIAASAPELRTRAERWADAALERGLRVELADGESTIGGGSLPGETQPTTLVCLPPAVTAARLRQGTPAVLSRTRSQRAMLDLRTVAADEEADLLSAVLQTAHG
jgi:L-seryl-tRNA(Ser) seleniumtransferase